MSARAREIGVIAVAGGWWLFLATVFLYNRGDDVGRLPALTVSFIASLAHGPVWGLTGLLASVAGAALAGLIGLSWYGLGGALARRIPRLQDRSPHQQGIAEVADLTLLGAAAWSLIWFLLGTVYLYRAPVAVVALLAGIALAATSLVRHQVKPGALVRAAGSAVLILVITTQALALIAALAPPTAKDTVLYHFALPKAYLAAGGGIEVPYNIAGYYPLGVEMHVVWAMLLGAPLGARVGETAAGAALFLFAPLLVMVVYGWARERGVDRAGAVAAALMVAWVPTAYDVAASAYVDLALAAYTAMAVRAFARWWATLDGRHLVWITVGIAGALSIKLSAAFVILPLALLSLLRSLKGSGPGTAVIAGSAIGALGTGVALAAPWYVRNWIRTGSPLFPSISGSGPPRRPAGTSSAHSSTRPCSRSTGTPAAPSTTSWRPSGSRSPPSRINPSSTTACSASRSPRAAHARLGALAAPARRRATPGRLVSACLFVFWLFSSQQLRYLLPAAARPRGRHRGGRQRARRGAVPAAPRPPRGRRRARAAGRAGVVPDAGSRARRARGRGPREPSSPRRLDYYPYYEVVNHDLPSTARSGSSICGGTPTTWIGPTSRTSSSRTTPSPATCARRPRRRDPGPGPGRRHHAPAGPARHPARLRALTHRGRAAPAPGERREARA